jgi:hypothetical protein
VITHDKAERRLAACCLASRALLPSAREALYRKLRIEISVDDSPVLAERSAILQEQSLELDGLEVDLEYMLVEAMDPLEGCGSNSHYLRIASPAAMETTLGSLSGALSNLRELVLNQTEGAGGQLRSPPSFQLERLSILNAASDTFTFLASCSALSLRHLLISARNRLDSKPFVHPTSLPRASPPLPLATSRPRHSLKPCPPVSTFTSSTSGSLSLSTSAPTSPVSSHCWLLPTLGRTHPISTTRSPLSRTGGARTCASFRSTGGSGDGPRRFQGAGGGVCTTGDMREAVISLEKNRGTGHLRAKGLWSQSFLQGYRDARVVM